jgi:hypothetical protein
VIGLLSISLHCDCFVCVFGWTVITRASESSCNSCFIFVCFLDLFFCCCLIVLFCLLRFYYYSYYCERYLALFPSPKAPRAPSFFFFVVLVFSFCSHTQRFTGSTRRGSLELRPADARNFVHSVKRGETLLFCAGCVMQVIQKSFRYLPCFFFFFAYPLNPRLPPIHKCEGTAQVKKKKRDGVVCDQ